MAHSAPDQAISPLATQPAPGAGAGNGTTPEELARLRALLQSMGTRAGQGSRSGGGGGGRLMEPGEQILPSDRIVHLPGHSSC